MRHASHAAKRSSGSNAARVGSGRVGGRVGGGGLGGGSSRGGLDGGANRSQARGRAQAAGRAQANHRGKGASLGTGSSRNQGATYVGERTPSILSGTPGAGGIGIGGLGGGSRGNSSFGGSGLGGGNSSFGGSGLGGNSRGNLGGSGLGGGRANTSGNGEGGAQTLITRRNLLLGALGIGAVAAIGGGAAAIISSGDSTPEVSKLSVPESAVTNATSLDEVEDSATCMQLAGEFDLPLGTLVFCNDDKFAACLIPTDGAKPLAQVAILSLSSGNYYTVVEQAQGQDKGFEIYDVRATSQAVIWTEANILDGVWRIFAGKLASDADEVTNIQQLDEGACGEFQTPSIAAVGSNVFWQIMPQANSDVSASKQTLQLKRAAAGSANAEVIYESTGRAATAPYPTRDAVVITPRNPNATSCYQLTRINATSGDVSDELTLPTSMKPLEAGWGKAGFNFAFEATYSYGDGIANLGTYTPTSKPANSYDDAKWIRFDRTPTCAPAWCGNYFMVKSTKAVCGVDAANRRYFVLDVPSGADDWGEWLASTGECSALVTYSSIDSMSVSGETTQCCRVRVWNAVS